MLLTKLMFSGLLMPTFFFCVCIMGGCKKTDYLANKQPTIKDTVKVIEETAALIYFDSVAANQSLFYEKSYIFKFGYLGYQYTYSDMLKLDNGKFLFACSREKQITDFTPYTTVISSSLDSGKTWSSPQPISISIEEPYLNVFGPSLVEIGKGHVILFFGVKFNVGRIDIYMKESFDYGNSWNKEKVVYATNQGYQTTNNNRVLYNNGRLFVPLAVPNRPEDLFGSITNNMSCFYYYSDDLGKSWKKSAMFSLKDTALLEPDIVKINDNELLMNFRLNLGFVLFARSKNNGQTWRFEYSKIKSPSSPQKIINLNGTNTLLMVWNNSNKRFIEHVGNRNPLTLAISNDKGYKWKVIANLEETDGYDYSYPSISQDAQNVYITYFELYPRKIGYSTKFVKIQKKNLL